MSTNTQTRSTEGQEQEQTAGTQSGDPGIQAYKEGKLSADVLGYSKMQLLGIASPGIIVGEAARNGFIPLYPGIAVTVALFLAAGVIVGATGEEDTIFEYVGRVVRERSQTHHLTSIRNPEASALDGARNESVLGRLGRVDPGRVPLVGSLPGVSALWEEYLGGDGATRCEDIVPLKKPLRDEYAVVTDDGALIGAIEIRPANMATADDAAWDRRVNSLTNALNSTVEGKNEWYNPVRAVDYRPRFNRYQDAFEAFRRDALRDDSRLAYSDVLADVCRERMGIVQAYQKTSFERRHYWIVRVEQEEAVLGDLSEGEGGLHTVWGLGTLLTKRAMKEQAGSDEQVEQMLDTLTKRMQAVAAKVRGIDGVGATPISSVELSQVAADNFRAANIYAHGDFKAFVRQAPSPGRSSGDPEHDADYSHITNTLEGRDYGRSVYDVAGDEVGGSGEDVADESGAQDETGFPTGDVNAGVDAGVVASESELVDHYKSALAPHEYRREQGEPVVVDDEVVCGTIAVSDYPARPGNGMLESVMNYLPPGVAPTVSTQFEKDDRSRMERRISDAKEIMVKKAGKYRKKRWAPEILVKHFEQKAREADEMLDALTETTHELFDVSTYITVRAPDEEALRSAKQTLEARLRDQKASVRSFSKQEHVGFMSSAPFAVDRAKQSVKLRADGLASLFSWSSRNLFEPGGIALGLHRDRDEPTIFDLWNRDTGFSIGVFGKVGSGKTTTSKRITLRLQLLTDYLSLLDPRRGDSLLVMMDPLEEFAGLCKLFGGERLVIGPGTNINIMAYEEHDEELQADDESAREDAERRTINHIQNYYEMRGLRGFGEKRSVWQTAISRAYDDHGPKATLQDVFDGLRHIANHTEEYVDSGLEGEAREYDIKNKRGAATDIISYDIEDFTPGGEFYNLTQPSDLDFSENNVWYLDLNRYESEKNTGPGGFLMEILLDRVYDEGKRRKRENDGRTTVVMDEAHYILQNDSNLASLRQMILHHRHYDIAFIFSTQQISEFFKEGEMTEAAKTIYDNLATRIFHFTDELSPAWLDDLDMNHRELEYIGDARTGNDGVAEALVMIDKEGNYPIRVDYDNSKNPREFAVVEYDPAEHGDDLPRFLREYRDAEGRDVCEWNADLSPPTPDTPTDETTQQAVSADGGED